MRKYEFGNPLDILIAKESRTCKGCQHHKNLTILNQVYELCALGKKFGKRCKQYEIKLNGVNHE